MGGHFGEDVQGRCVNSWLMVTIVKRSPTRDTGLRGRLAGILMTIAGTLDIYGGQNAWNVGCTHAVLIW
jgi:hypothetical protein